MSIYKNTPMLVQKTNEVNYLSKSNITSTLKVTCPKCEKCFHIVFDKEYKYCPLCGQCLKGGYSK